MRGGSLEMIGGMIEGLMIEVLGLGEIEMIENAVDQ